MTVHDAPGIAGVTYPGNLLTKPNFDASTSLASFCPLPSSLLVQLQTQSLYHLCSSVQP